VTIGHVDILPPEALLARFSPERIATAETYRALVQRAIPGVIERVRPGWGLIGYDLPVGRRTVYFAFVWPEVEHVHLGFEYGIHMDDPDGRLEGRGRKVRWVTAVRPGDVDPRTVEPLVREAARVASMSRDERLARLLDRGLAAGRPLGA
jgi:hypothetical protein